MSSTLISSKMADNEHTTFVTETVDGKMKIFISQLSMIIIRSIAHLDVRTTGLLIFGLLVCNIVPVRALDPKAPNVCIKHERWVELWLSTLRHRKIEIMRCLLNKQATHTIWLISFNNSKWSSSIPLSHCITSITFSTRAAVAAANHFKTCIFPVFLPHSLDFLILPSLYSSF